MIARNSSFTYKGKPVDVQQVGRDLGVRYVLGRQRAGGGQQGPRYRPLHRRREPVHICAADRFDRDLTDIIAVQDELARIMSQRSRSS